MSALAALAAGLLLASPLARALPAPSPTMPAPVAGISATGHPMRNRSERRSWISRWRRGLL